jgi:tetratricopeptide (TPR) repeat protein
MVGYPFYGSGAGGWLNRNACPTFSGTSGRPKTERVADRGRNIQLSPFYWKQFTEYGLTKEEQIWLLKTQSHCFMALGLLKNAVEVSEHSLSIAEELKNWSQGSSILRSLVNLYQPLGQLNMSLEIAKKAISYADLSNDQEEQILNYCRLAHIYHLIGNLSSAESYCQKAEELKKKNGYLYLTTVPGFRYCDVLLDKSKGVDLLKNIISRGEYILENYTTELDPALGNLIIARSYYYLSEFDTAEEYFSRAIKDMLKSRRMEYMPPFYFARTDFYLNQNRIDQAQDDLNSALEIIERSDMKMYLADYYLMHGRCCLANHDNKTALSRYNKAKLLIQEMGYHIRDIELDLFAAQLCQQYDYVASKNADYYLQEAKKHIEIIGLWRLTPYIESLTSKLHI